MKQSVFFIFSVSISYKIKNKKTEVQEDLKLRNVQNISAFEYYEELSLFNTSFTFSQ